jgi:hypothetical protein
MKFRSDFLYGIVMIVACACSRNEGPYQGGYANVNQIPYGQTGVVQNTDLTGQGNQTNAAGTGLIIEGIVRMDALSGIGEITVLEGSTLILNESLTMAGGSTLRVFGTVITSTLSQTGDVYINGGRVQVNGKYQISGGATTYLYNALIQAGEFVIIGDIQAIQNQATESSFVYSLIQSTGINYLFRAGGATVCGPILFTNGNDQGSSGVPLTNVTDQALSRAPNLFSLYGISASELYQYQESCTPLAQFPMY